MIPQATTLFDRRTRTLVPATSRFDLTAEEILAVEAVWSPWRNAAVDRLVNSSYPEDQMPEHWHWDWTVKVPKLRDLGYCAVSIESSEGIQGLMLLATLNKPARLPPDAGGPLVYVDYVESAPWNIKPLAEDPHYGAVGTRLLQAAIQVSLTVGYKGRVGLHSLPQAEVFYQEACGMVHLGVDLQYESLVYFEFTRELAQAFLDKEGSR